MISNKYEIVDKIKEGSFGIIFKGKNIRTQKLVAIKFESKDIEKKTLKNEARIYQYLGVLDGFPQLKWFGSDDHNNFLVIDLLGISLAKMINQYKKFSIKTVLLLGIQMIKRIQVLHEKGLLHRDIKPENFLFGLGEATNKLHLIDFGISKRYDYDGTHISETKIHKLIGTPNFVSINVHNGLEPSRRDDLESCMYIILLMTNGTSMWYCHTNVEQIINCKIEAQTSVTTPTFIKILLDYICNMGFDETPDYNYIIKLMIDVFNEHKFTYNNQFEWTKT